MAGQKQTREQLGVKAKDRIVLKAKVAFAKIDKLIDGDALAAENTRRKGLGMIEADKPFRSIAIEDIEVVEGNGTPLANFHSQDVYTAKGSGKQTMSLESKSLFPPSFGHIQNGEIVQIADPMKNPAPGQEIFVLIEAYGSKSFNKLGSSFNAIVYPEGEIKFYEGGGGNSLAGFGQALNLPVQGLAPQAPVQPNLFGQQPAQTPVQPNGFGQQPAQTPVQPNGFGQAPVQDNGFGQASVQPEPEATPNPFGGFGTQPAQAATAGRASNPFA